MNVKYLALASVGSVVFAGAASAAIDGLATVVDAGQDVDGNTIWQVYLESDDAGDKLLAINGDANVSPLVLAADSVLVNRGGNYANGDRLRPPFAATDSYLTMGSVVLDADTQFSPDFLGTYSGPYGPSSLNGQSGFSQADNGGYFDSNPTTAVNPIGGQILIAQFILAPGSGFTYRGTASYNDGTTGELTNIRFSTVPAPGALALLGLAGLAGGRRRR